MVLSGSVPWHCLLETKGVRHPTEKRGGSFFVVTQTLSGPRVFERATVEDSDGQLNLLASALKTNAKKTVFGGIIKPFQMIKAVNLHTSDSGAAIRRRALCQKLIIGQVNHGPSPRGRACTGGGRAACTHRAPRGCNSFRSALKPLTE